jgi:hypothetical protein
LAFGTASDPVVAAALYSGIAAVAATAAFIVAIVIARAGLLRRLRIEKRASAEWNPLIAQCADRVPEELPPLRARDVETFLVLWCRAQESLRGDAQDQLREMARRLDILPQVHRNLRSGRLRRVLLALVAVGHLRDRRSIPHLQKLVPESPTMLSLTAAQALIRIDSTLGIPQVLMAIAHRDDWSLAHVVSMLLECDAREVARQVSTAIAMELPREPAIGRSSVARLLRLHAAAQPELLRDALLSALVQTANPETLAAALAALWHPQDSGQARALVLHPEWPVRLAAVRALGRLGTTADVAQLIAALSDRSWWVRYRAAQALCALPGLDMTWLRELSARMDDRFAGDMLRQALAEREAT